jgi:hypothetical protein
LSFFLVDEFRNQEQDEAADVVLRDLSESDPLEPYPLISLAEQKLYYEEKPTEALSTIEQAIPRARVSGHFRRNALGVKARIALDLQRYDLIPDILRELMSVPAKRGDVDIGTERDFFDRLPPGVIDERLAAEFEEFCQQRGRPKPQK